MFRQKIKHISEKYERHISSVALFSGFVFDSITSERIDLWISNAFLLFYLALVMMGIAFLNLYDAKKLRGNAVEKIFPWITVVMQYAFGGLFSRYFILYFRSSSFSAHWLFILILVALMIGNEMFRKRYIRFRFHIVILYIALFAFTIFYVPLVTKMLGVQIFLLSGLVSLVCVWVFIFVLYLVFPTRIRESAQFLALSIGGIYTAVNLMYFTNVIPPIPLALKDAEVAHSIEKTPAGDYRLTFESVPWYDFSTPVFHAAAGGPVYFYSSVFSPTDLNTNITHSWQYYDEKKRTWVEALRLRFPIAGGRDGGYRGYSMKQTISAGNWRVDVVTDRGQLLGRYAFTVVTLGDLSNLLTGVR